MTMRTRTDYICECGQTGYSILSENDQPYGKSWEREEFFGMICVKEGVGPRRDRLHCRACGQTGKVR
jgi:hypothetical protein